MSEIGKGAFDAEKELSSVVERISQSARSIDEFRSASTTLGKVSQENLELVEKLKELAKEIEHGAAKLNETGIAEFNLTLSKGVENVRGAISDDLKSHFRNVATILETEQKTANAQLKDSLIEGIQTSAARVDESIARMREELNKAIAEQTARVEKEVAARTRKVFLATVVLSSLSLLGIGFLVLRLL